MRHVLNREQRRKIKKIDSFDNMIIEFTRPFLGFLNDIKNDNVRCDDKNNIFMDFSKDKKNVETLANAGKSLNQIPHAIPNLKIFLETYFQVAAYCFTEKDLIEADQEISYFNRRIIKSLELGSPILKEDLEKSYTMIDKIELLFRRATYPKVLRVINEISKAIHDNVGKHKIITADMLREWLVNELQKDFKGYSFQE